jgi:hypothetical protein
MRIFVIGASHTGKSPLARRLAESLNIRCLSAGGWVRERFPEPRPAADASSAERAAHIERLTQFAISELRRDPNVSVASLRSRLTPDEHAVIEGMRNVYDFTHVFDPRSDHVVALFGPARTDTGPFDQGIGPLLAYVDWMIAIGLLDADRKREYTFGEFGAIGDPRPNTLEHAIVDYLAYANRFRQIASLDPNASVPAPASRSHVHAEIPPIKTHVRAEYLYNMDSARVGELRPCTAFAISSYVGQAPTFQILLGDGAVFSYVPPNALVDPDRRAEPTLELGDLVYHDCKHTEISVHDVGGLRGEVLAYFKKRDLWMKGEYRFTVDWYTGNEMLHCIALANGQFALLPSHKIKFGDHEQGFEPYKKIRREWRVGE